MCQVAFEMQLSDLKNPLLVLQYPVNQNILSIGPGLLFPLLAGPSPGPVPCPGADPSALPRWVAQQGWGMKRCRYGRGRDVQTAYTLKPNKYVMEDFACDRMVGLT